MNEKILTAKDISKVFYTKKIKTTAVKNTNFSVGKGEFISITGESGSGKSTLLNVISTIEKPTTGDIFIDGENISSFNEIQLSYIRNRKIGFVFQMFNLIGHLSVIDNVALPYLYATGNKEDALKKAAEILDEIDMGHRIDHYPHQLSGGQQQRVAIARALINNPKIIFADEPTGNLDVENSLIIMRILERQVDTGCSLILVTHDKIIAQRAERILKIEGGELLNV